MGGKRQGKSKKAKGKSGRDAYGNDPSSLIGLFPFNFCLFTWLAS
jgi:hypothetical protein